MNKFIVTTCLISLCMLLNLNSANADIMRYENPQYYHSDTQNNPYDTDLSRVEDSLFGRTYRNDNNAVRLNRIEHKLFNKTYSTKNIAQRMNNVLSQYQNKSNRAYTANNYGNYYNTRRAGFNNYYNPTSFRDRLYNNFVGRPTGFTPAIGSHILNGFAPGFDNSYSGTRGWGYQNSYRPTMTGAGVQILN